MDIKSSLVLITSSDQKNARFGTGFVIEPAPGKYFVITCAHVLQDVGGADHVLVSGQPAEVRAAGTSGGIDLAVLKAARPDTGAALRLAGGGADLKGRRFDAAGFHSYNGHYLIRETAGFLGSEAILEDRAHTVRVRAWELMIGSENRLQPGYSGSPVVDRAGGDVIAIVSHREGDGQRGLAISVEAVGDIWPDRPVRRASGDSGRPPGGAEIDVADGVRQGDRTSIFVGRERELGLLRAGATAALAGRGSIGFVTGEAGAGKSRLVAEFVSELDSEGRHLAATAGADAIAGKRLSYGPFKDLMEQILASASGTDTAASLPVTSAPTPIDIVSDTLSGLGITSLGPLTSFAGRFTQRLHERIVSSSPYEDTNQRAATSIDQGTLFDCYAKAIFAVSRHYPLVLVIEDLHWADESSLMLLMHLARTVGSNRLFVTCTFRSEEARQNPLFAELQDELCGRGALSVDLGDEGPDGTAAEEKRRFCGDYLMARYGTTFTDELPGILYNLTKANPLFLTEILGYLEHRGLIRLLDRNWTLGGPIDDVLQLPSRIEHVISQRINRLDEDLTSILRCASVEGETFTLEVVSRIQGREQRALLHIISDKLIRLHQLVLPGLRRRLGNATRIHTFGFHHIMTQRYVYDHLLTSIERQILHEEVATCLEDIWGDAVQEIAPQLATHFSLAAEAEKTIRYALTAGEAFIQEYGWSEAVKMARLGLQTWRENEYLAGILGHDVLVRLCLLNAQGEAQGGIRSESVDHIQAGVDVLLPCLSDLGRVRRPLAAQVNLTLGRLVASKQVTAKYHGNEYLDEAVRIFEELADKEGIIAALSVACYDTNLADQSAADQQLENRRRCVALSEELGQPTLLAKSLSDLALHYLNFNSAEERPLELALRLAHEAVEIAARQNAIAELDARLILSWVQHHCGYYQQLLGTREELLRLARRHGQTIFEAEALTDIGHYHSLVMSGSDIAEHALLAGLEFRGQIGRHAVHDRENLAAFLFRKGRFNETVELLEHSIDEGDLQRAARARAMVAQIFAMTGRESDAVALLDEIERALAQIGGQSGDVCARMLAHARLGHDSMALALAREAERTVEQGAERGLFHVYNDTATCLAEVYLRFGELSAANKWIDVATEHWARLAGTTDVRSLVMYWEHRLVVGQVAVSDGNLTKATPILEEVYKQLASFGHYRAVESLLQLGIATSDTDRSAAIGYLMSAESLAGSLGLVPLLDQVRRQIEVLHGQGVVE